MSTEAGVPCNDQPREGARRQNSASKGSAGKWHRFLDTRELNRHRTGVPKMMVIAEQLDELIGNTSGRNNISKELKQSLLQFRKSVALAKKEYE